MVARAKTPYIPLSTYFGQEDTAEVKSEYYDGVIVAMAGASLAHVAITFNLSLELGTQLRGKTCRAFGTDLRVYVERCNMVYYPDLTVACDPPQFMETRLATLLNPSLIVEVLSPSTELFDRRTKFDCYRTLESLKAYVLVSQDEPRIELYTRHPEGFWQYDVAKGLEAVIQLKTIGCELRLADVYAQVDFLPTVTEEEIEESV